MWEQTILRGKVSAYPSDMDKGLVEVKIGALDSKNDTVLAQVEQSMSGVYWLPEIGDVVDVALSPRPGDPARIIHIHRQQQDQQVSKCWTEKNDRKQLRTRSGHTLTLDDTQDGAQISLQTAGGLELLLSDKGQNITLHKNQKETPLLTLNTETDEVTLSTGKKLTIQCGPSHLTFDSEGNLTIHAKGSLTLQGKSITLSAQDKLEGKGEQVTLSGSMSAKLSGENQLELHSGGITQVKGNVVKLN